MTRTRCIVPALVLVVAGAVSTPRPEARAGARAAATRTDAVPSRGPVHETTNGLSRASADEELRGTLLKYTARCALPEGQFLEGVAAGGGAGRRQRYPGALGLAPQWLDGTCGVECQERVSSCLIALTNRTGKHVALSLLSSAPGMGEKLRPGAEDLPFPHQEGAFFGNVFTGRAYACRGRDAAKGPQVKRFCAVDPQSCSGLAEFRDAGLCEAACEMDCRGLPDGSRRCAAVSCRDPDGRVWRSPITTYLRNQIEAGNADRVSGPRRDEDGLDGLDRGDRARFELVDFGRRPGAASALVLSIGGRGAGGRIEAWLDGRVRLGAIDITETAGVVREQAIALPPRRIAGRHAVLLKVVAGRDIGRLSTIEVR
jgi:hypothetical protein